MTHDPHPATAEVAGATALSLAEDLRAGRTTSVALTTALLARIGVVDGPGPIHLRAVLALSDDALAQAAARDEERAQGLVRGPLHGVPVLVKDNVEAVGLPGSAGSFALMDRAVVRDSTVVARLRAGGLVVLGATNLSEWANMRSPRSTSGWSAVGGLTGNPWALDRSAGGSSSGSGAAVAAGLAPLAVGTETDGSITCPSSLNGCVGLKPTLRLLPTDGIVPIAASQDAPGPMARSVADAGALLDVLAATDRYASACGSLALDDLRLGIASGWRSQHPGTDALFDATLESLRRNGSTLTDADVTPVAGVGADELVVLLAELHDDLGGYLAQRAGDGVRSVADVVAFDVEHAGTELVHFGHEFLEAAAAGSGRAGPDYAAARARCLEWAVDRTLEPALRGPGAPEFLISPAYSPAWKSDLVAGDHFIGGGLASAAPSIAGWPVLCVPMGLVDGLPVGLVLVGRPHSEARLLAAGHAVEAMLGLHASGALTPAWRPAGRG